MTSEIKADKWSPASGTAGTIGDSGDTFTVPSGVTLNTSSATLSIPSTVITSQTEKSSLADADKFLISDSAASGALKYVQKSNLPSGGLVKVAESYSTSEVANVTFTDCFTSAYASYRLIGMFHAVSSGTKLELNYKNSGGTLSGSSYQYLSEGQRIDSGSSIENAANGNYGDSGGFELTYNLDDSSLNSPACLDLVFYDPRQSTFDHKNFNGMISHYASDNKFYTQPIAGRYKDSGDATGLIFTISSGNIKRHDVVIYGLTDTGN